MNRLFTSLAGVLTSAMIIVWSSPIAAMAQTAVFINELHYDNTGTDAGEAIEIAGPAGTDFTGWSLVLYNGANGAVYDTHLLTGIIPNQSNGFGTVTLAYPANGIQNGSPDGIALVNPLGVVQFLSYEGTFTAVGGPASGMMSTDIGVAENGTEPVGQSLRLGGTGTTYENFTWSPPAPATFGAINTGQTFIVPVNQPVILTCGGSLTVPQGMMTNRALSATDADGIVESFTLSSITPPAAGNLFTITDTTAAAAIGGSATATLNVEALGAPGVYALVIEAANNDAPTPQTETCGLMVSVPAVLSVGAVQGPIGDSDDGLLHRSPYAPSSGNGASAEFVIVRGVIYQKTLARTSSGGLQNGFFLQSDLGQTDGDPQTSDGIFVFMGGFTDLIGGYVPQVGDEVILRARVTEFFNLTELSSASLVQLVREDVDIDMELETFDANPPDDLSEAYRYWERHEGMRARIPAQSLVLDGRNVFPSNLDGEVWVLNPMHPIAQRANPYARRSFRDPHPLDNMAGPFDDGNGYRIVLGSLGIKAAAGDNTALIAPSRTFDLVTNSPVGGVYFSFEKYQIEIEDQLALSHGADPSLNNPPTAVKALTLPWPLFSNPAQLGVREFSVATFNVENLYDFRDDPFDGCDFQGNSGCSGVSPPFDYVPESDADYQARLADLARQIISDLHGPAVLLIQEAEDQDICTASGGSLVCGLTDNADGRPDTLQELALRIAALGGPSYAAAYDRDGADDRGIVSAFLYRTDRVEMLTPAPSDPVLGASPLVNYATAGLPYNADVQNPKALNVPLPPDVDISTGVDGGNVFTRAPQVGLFRVWRNGIGRSIFLDVYLVSNHFSSTPDARVGQRSEQARYNAAIVAAIQSVRPKALVAVGGDLNVFPRPDDPFEPGEPSFPSDQLAALYDQGLVNLFDTLAQQVPASAYSYVFDGQAQTLDQIFVTPALLLRLAEIRASHINSDWPADEAGDGLRGTSDHDPQVAKFKLIPTIQDLLALLRYFDADGAFSGSNLAPGLAAFLERAERLADEGRLRSTDPLVRVFFLQLNTLGTRAIRADAAAALAREAGILFDSIFVSLRF